MLEKVFSMKINPRTKKQIEHIAEKCHVDSTAIGRLALYVFLEEYKKGGPALNKRMATMEKAGGKLPEDYVIDTYIEVHDDKEPERTDEQIVADYHKRVDQLIRETRGAMRYLLQNPDQEASDSVDEAFKRNMAELTKEYQAAQRRLEKGK